MPRQSPTVNSAPAAAATPLASRRALVRFGGAVLGAGAALGLPGVAGGAVPTERRIGLVIGNWDYVRGPLHHPQADAQLMTATLRDLNFQVTERLNLTRQSFHQTLDEFVAQTRSEVPGTVAVFYYAGHGVQLEGHNYLIPVDRALQNNSDVRDYGIPAARLLRQLGEANPQGVCIVVLDACRNNPFSRVRGRGQGGLAPLQGPRGMLVAYSTDPDRPALDGGARNGRNSVYTEALAEQMRQPGVPLETVFKRVRQVVSQATQGRQTPWENTSLLGDFYLLPVGR